MSEKERAKVTVVSLAPWSPLYVHHQCGYFVIPAKGPDEPYAKLIVQDGFAARDFGDRRIEPQKVEARDLAEDLIGVHRDDNLMRFGVFVAAGEEPTEEEVAKARELMEKTLRYEISEADSHWAKTHDRKQISLHAIEGAKYFGLKREWCVDMREMVPCDSCQELVSPLAVKCPKCGDIRDWEKARTRGLVTQEAYTFATGKTVVASEEVKRGPGRPPNVSRGI